MLAQSELNQLVAEILEISASLVRDDSDLEELGWDSLSDLTFLSIADERYHRRIDPARLNKSETPGDLLRLLQ